jgi:hypothetical protein
VTLVSLEEPRVRELITQLPPFAPGQPLARLHVPGVSEKVTGIWSLWGVAIQAAERREQRLLPLFLTDDGRSLAPTARAVWDRLVGLADGITMLDGPATDGEAKDAYEVSRRAAEEHGEHLFQELLRAHQERLERERGRAQATFAARRRVLERVGLPQVREYRMARLDVELQAWHAEMRRREQTLPELSPLLIVRVVDGRQ